MDNNQKNDQPATTGAPFAQNEVQAALNIQNIDTATPKKPNKLPAKLIIAGLVLIAVVGIAAYLIVTKDKSEPVVSVQPKTEVKGKTVPKEEIKDPALKKFIYPTTTEKWLDKPVPIAKQGFYSSGYSDNEQYAEYFEVGTHGDKKILMTVLSQIGETINLYEKAPDGSIVLILHPDDQAVYNENNEPKPGEEYKQSIIIDKTIHYDSLSMPVKLDIGLGYSITKESYPSLGQRMPLGSDEKNSYQDVKILGASKIIKSEHKYVDTSLTSIGYFIETPLKTKVTYKYEPFALKLDNFQWQKGMNALDEIKPITRGCGGATVSVTKSEAIKDADVQQVGKTADGQIVYELKDPNNVLLQKAYDEFRQYYADDKTNIYAKISKEDFIKEHAVIIGKDSYGQWLVYVRSQLSPIGGCAKPVVYLYPTKEQQVTVKVGADVKISDPLYNPKNGWTALAKPDGQLVVNGTKYDSLFWEGPGAGQYPSITSGTVVSAKDAPLVIKSQLMQLGLNAKEISDFEAYWKDKLPKNKPYVRLTWLTTEQMNTLAPLHISPKPDTVIRVFLDFTGLDKPIVIPQQKLTTLPRKGFTVVEWGGLANFPLK